LEDKYNKSVEGICSFIWDLEKKFDLFSKKEEDVYFWQVIRFHLYYDLTQKIEIFGAPHGAKKLTFFDYINIAAKITKSLLFKNPFLSLTTHTNIVMPHSRQLDGVDIYSEQLIKNLPPHDTLVLYGKDIPLNSKGSKNLAATTYWNYFLSRVNKKPLSYETTHLLAEIQSLIFKHWNVNIDIRKQASTRISRFKKDSKAFEKLFKRKKTKSLYIVVAYLNQPIIDAAHKCNIKVTELQHGTFTKYHLGYSFPISNNKIPYFPDKIMTFGSFWGDYTPLPNNVKTTIIGAPYIQKIKDKTKDKTKVKNLIVFCSQGAISKDLFPFAIETSRLMPDYKFIYRLHPSEQLDQYENTLKSLEIKNFSLSHKSPNIFDLLASAEYQAGVFSTTLLEGMALNTKSILINMSGIEYMKPVIEAGDSILVKTPKEFKNILPDLELTKNSKYYYADPISDFTDILKE